MTDDNKYPGTLFYKGDAKTVLNDLGQERALYFLDQMLLIRNFELRAEQGYRSNKIWGFLHLYIGQEAIQSAIIAAIGRENAIHTATYRCHALALLLGMSAKEGMSELYGKANGNAGGMGGSMHFFMDNMLGGHGIVGGQFGIGIGAAFSLKYKGIKDKISIAYTGDGAMAQGTFHETMNLAALWNLPYMCVIENNRWGMGTAEDRALANLPIGENMAKAYGVKSYTVNGLDFFDMYALFKEANAYILENQRPVIVECVGERFRGHSISDPGLYRTKEHLSEIMKNDPIHRYRSGLEMMGWITDEAFESRNEAMKTEVVEAMKFADESPFPDVNENELGVFTDE